MFKLIINYFKSKIFYTDAKKFYLLKSLIISNLELLENIGFLIEKGHLKGIEELTRCYIEACFNIIFIIKEPELIEKRLKAYEYFIIKSRIDIPEIEEIINSNEEHLNNYFENRESNDNSEKDFKNFRENIKKIINSDSYQNNKKKLEDLKYRDVKNEINNIKSKNIKSKNIKYYQCFTNGEKISSLKELTDYIGYKNYYILQYSQYSKKIHFVDPFEYISDDSIKRDIIEISIDTIKEYLEKVVKLDLNTCYSDLLMLKYHFSLSNKDVFEKVESDENFKINYDIFLKKYMN